jgi:CAAX prenyl protease-like protein
MTESIALRADDRTHAILATGVVWLLFVLASLNEIATTDPGVPLVAPRLGEVVVAVLIALALVGVGFVVNDRVSRFRPARVSAHSRRAFYAGLAGVTVGLVVVIQTLILATFDQDLRQRYAMFMGEPWWPPLLRAFSAGVIEEVLFRYIGIAAVAALAFRRLGNADRAYRIALVSTAVVFGVLHFPGLTLAGVVVVLVNTAAGLLFGWIYWHWGLRYAILCHFLGGLVNQSLGPRLIG